MTLEFEVCIITVSYIMLPIAVSEPTSPTNLRQDTSANTESSTVIQWSAPVFNGGNGMTIVSYAVSVNGQAESVNGGDSTYTITGLEYNTNYSVEVVAVNSCGLQSEPASITVYLEEKGTIAHSITYVMYIAI